MFVCFYVFQILFVSSSPRLPHLLKKNPMYNMYNVYPYLTAKMCESAQICSRILVEPC